MKNKEKIVKALHEIELKRGIIKPDYVVEEAKSISSPLHDIFEWDDKKASQEYRLWQARHLLNHVRVEFMGRESEGFYNISTKIEEVAQRGYYSAKTVFSNKELYQNVLEQALQEIEYWTEKYKNIKELEGLVNKSKLKSIVKKAGK